MSLESPEYEIEFYESQVQKMERRFASLFKRWKVNWPDFRSFVRERLRESPYWLWVFYCGFEDTIKKADLMPKSKRKFIYQQSQRRISRIIGDHFKNQEYVNGL